MRVNDRRLKTTFLLLLIGTLVAGGAAARTLPGELSELSAGCVECHATEDPGIVGQWQDSAHYRSDVGCYECHQAESSDSDAIEHGGAHISVIVSPKDCARCHEKEVKEFTESHHARGGRIIDSLDNFLAEVVEGNRAFISPGFPKGNSAAAVSGCWQCHGSKVTVLPDGTLDAATWPNTGIGRLNPDGTEGACSSCHLRHDFSIAVARGPETCGRCHLGPDHPQYEVWKESKHGIAFLANREDMNLDHAKWVAGEDYTDGPSCASCHMSATRNQEVTHDIGLRISWNNRPITSIRPEVSDKKMGLPGADISWETRRESMKDVCVSCHAPGYVENFYTQYDSFIELYNEKYAEPGKALMALAKPLMKDVKFANKLDWTWFELWHHEGRRARHGASMMGPDYAHWHGTYDLAKHFYTKMVPELEELIEQGKASGDSEKQKAAEALQEGLDEILKSDNHKWYLGK